MSPRPKRGVKPIIQQMKKHYLPDRHAIGAPAKVVVAKKFKARKKP